jgi:hypothetical protein
MAEKIETNVIYENLKKESNLDEDSLDQIVKDINRTFFPAYHRQKDLEEQGVRSEDEELEMGRCATENEIMRQQIQSVLIAYNSQDPKIGYVQGFNSIVGAILYIFHQAKEEIQKKGETPAIDYKLKFDDEEVFYTFYGLMTLLGWRERFFDGMSDIGRMCDDFSVRMQREDPTLYKKFFENQVNTT